MGSPSYPRSAVLVFGRSSVYSLLPSSLFAQVELHLQNGRLVEAEELLEQAAAGGRAGSGDQRDILCYWHQCIAFAFMRQTRFREATAHFIKGVVDPRIPVSYFDELRPSLFAKPSHEKDDDSSSDADTNFVDVDVWDGVREYMPDETSVEEIIATNLVRNYSPHLRPDAILASPAENEPTSIEPSIPESYMTSGTRTYPATVAMREVLKGEATEMVKNILVVVLGSPDMWSRDVIKISSTALALLYAYDRDVNSLLALFAPPPSAVSTPSSHPISRSGSRPSSRLASSSHTHPSNGHQVPPSPLTTPHVSLHSQTIQTAQQELVLPFIPEILAPVLSRLNLWSALLEMWKVAGDAQKVVDILAGLTEGTYTDPSVIDPLGQIFTILSSPQSDPSTPTVRIGLSMSEPERSSLMKKWAVWLTGKDIERGLKLLMSSQPTRHGRPTAAGRGRAMDRERDTQRADDLAILSELRSTSLPAAKRYLEWLVIGRGIGRGGKETMDLFEELVWNYVDEVLGYVQDESIGKLWRAKAASYASSSGIPSAASSPPPPLPRSDFLPSPTYTTPSHRSPFLSYFTLTTPDTPSKRARVKGLLLLQSLGEGKKIVRDLLNKIRLGECDKVLGLEMAILHSKIPSARVALKTLHNLRDTSTAEAYASSGGLAGVISTKTGVSAAEGCGMSDWSGWFVRSRGTTEPKEAEKGVQDNDMLKMLLEVYVEGGDMQQTARFLSSQAKKLDTPDILSLVPAAWPLRTLSTYLTRSLRHSQHITHEGQIVKAICAGQNLAVLENTFEVLREEGAIVEEVASDDEESGKGEEIGTSFDEKVMLHGRHGGGTEAVPVHVEDGEP